MSNHEDKVTAKDESNKEAAVEQPEEKNAGQPQTQNIDDGSGGPKSGFDHEMD